MKPTAAVKSLQQLFLFSFHTYCSILRFMKDDFHNRFENLVINESVMILATSDKFDNWSAPLYYLFEDRSFYFLSSKNSLHIKMTDKNPEASVSIFKNSDSFHDIKGVQMSGIVKRVKNHKETFKILKKYVNRYPCTAELFDIEKIVKSVREKTRVYSFIPEKIIYTDNSVEFGFKKEIEF